MVFFSTVKRNNLVIKRERVQLDRLDLFGLTESVYSLFLFLETKQVEQPIPQVETLLLDFDLSEFCGFLSLL